MRFTNTTRWTKINNFITSENITFVQNMF